MNRSSGSLGDVEEAARRPAGAPPLSGWPLVIAPTGAARARVATTAPIRASRRARRCMGQAPPRLVPRPRRPRTHAAFPPTYPGTGESVQAGDARPHRDPAGATGRRMRETVAESIVSRLPTRSPANGRRPAGEPAMTETLIPAIDETQGRDRPPEPADAAVHRRRVPRRAGRRAVHRPRTRRRAGPSPRSRRAAPADVDAAVARRAARRRRRALVAPEPRRPQADPGPLGRPDRGERARARDHRDDRRRQADHRHRRPRHAGDGGLHPLARGGDRQAVRPGRALARGHGRDDHPRAGRRRRRRHPVELPGPDGGLEARAGARDRQQRS